MYVLLAVLPILTALILMMGFKIKPGISLLISWLVTAISGFFFWKMNLTVIAAASLFGISKAIDIVLIIFGAVLLLNVQKQQGALLAINHSFRGLSKDRRIQVLLIAWLFSGLLEGAAGFGAAPPIVASFLVGLGFPALSAVSVGLIGNTLPVPYGGVGIPSVTLFRTLENDLQQHITQLVRQVVHIILIDGANGFVGFFQQVLAQGFMGLLSIPGAFLTQLAHHSKEIVKTIALALFEVHGGDVQTHSVVIGALTVQLHHGNDQRLAVDLGASGEEDDHRFIAI
jgi:L-lactate permease